MASALIHCWTELLTDTEEIEVASSIWVRLETLLDRVSLVPKPEDCSGHTDHYEVFVHRYKPDRRRVKSSTSWLTEFNRCFTGARRGSLCDDGVAEERFESPGSVPCHLYYASLYPLNLVLLVGSRDTPTFRSVHLNISFPHVVTELSLAISAVTWFPP